MLVSNFHIVSAVYKLCYNEYHILME